MKKNEPLFWLVLFLGAGLGGYLSPHVIIGAMWGFVYGWILNDIWPEA